MSRLRPGPLPKPIGPRPVSPSSFYGPTVPRCPATAIAIKREEGWKEVDVETEDPEEIRVLFKRWRAAGRAGVTSLISRKNTRRSYPREYKMKALRMYAIAREVGPDGVDRPVSKRKCAKLLGISPKMLSNWISKGNTIKNTRVGARRVPGAGRQVHWPEMEARLYQKFKALRLLGRAVNRKWFTRIGKKIFTEEYPKQIACVSDSETENENAMKIVLGCTFSDGWFKRFKSRWKLSWRQRTNVAQKSPAEKQDKVILFLQYVRRNSIPRLNEGLFESGRYQRHHILNMDQTPLPFEFLSNRTYNIQGVESIWIKTCRSGWEKRQATLMLTVCGDGELHIKPLLIFAGKGTTPAMQIERAKYDDRVNVQFQKNAYSDEAITLQWLENDIYPYLRQDSSNIDIMPPSLMALDVFSGQRTSSVLRSFKEHNMVSAFIPEGCTSLLQPMDTMVNAVLKVKICKLMEEEMDEHPEFWEGTCNVGERRVLMTRIVGTAWEWIHKKKGSMIRKSFQQAGLSIAIDGSEDNLVKIKGLPSLAIMDWAEGGLDCNLNWQGKTGSGQIDFSLQGDIMDPDLSDSEESSDICGDYVLSSELISLDPAGFDPSLNIT